MSKLSLTTPRQTVVSVLAGAVITFLALQVYDLLSAYPPVVPLSVPILVGLLAIAGFIYGFLIPRRLEDHKLGSQEAFVAVVTGKAMIVTGAVLAGAHVVYVLRYLDQLEAETPFQRVVHGAGTIVASVLFAAAGSLIEHNLVIKDPPDEPEGRHAEGAPS